MAFALLSGCDRQSTEEAQQQGQASGAENAPKNADDLIGTVDRTFAGSPIHTVTLVDPSGTMIDLNQIGSQGGGAPVLLNLWATWCAPCVVEMPLLDELAGELGESVRVVTVSEDLQGAKAVTPFFESRNFANLPQWMDQDNNLAFAFGGGAVLPLTVLYGEDGTEIWRVIGGYDWGSEEARALIAESIAD